VEDRQGVRRRDRRPCHKNPAAAGKRVNGERDSQAESPGNPSRHKEQPLRRARPHTAGQGTDNKI
jgi:hypothetical protein